MNIAIDFDDTITESPKLFRKLTREWTNANTVYIISSCNKPNEHIYSEIFLRKQKLLKDWGIEYKELFMPLEPIPQNKAKLCKKYNIGLMIDDNIKNLQAISKACEEVMCIQFVPS
jgi:hypothetical protein